MSIEYKNPNPERCKARVVPNDRFGSFHPHQCSKKPWKDGWCKQHHPGTEKERGRKRHEQYEAKIRQHPLTMLEEARKRIRELENEIFMLKEKLARKEPKP